MTLWTKVSTLTAFRGKRRLVQSVGDLDLLLLRIGEEVVALDNHCTHLGKRLEEGRITGTQIMCPFHGACFDLKTGAALSGPAVFPLHLFPTRIEGDDILVDLLVRSPSRPAGLGGAK